MAEAEPVIRPRMSTVSRRPDEPAKCDVCMSMFESEPDRIQLAAYRCSKCHGWSMCAQHAQAHAKSKGAGKHKIVDLNEGLCPAHPGQPLVAFCFPDETPLCEECLASTHRKHPTITLEEAAADQRGKLEAELTALAQREATLVQAREAAVQAAAESQQRQDALSTEVKAAFEPMINALSARMQVLLGNIQTTYAPLLQQLPSQAEARLAQTQRIAADARATVSSDAPNHLLAARKSVGDELKASTGPRVVVPRIRFVVELLQALDTVGSLMEAGSVDPARSVLGPFRDGRVVCPLVNSLGEFVSQEDVDLGEDLAIQLTDTQDAKCDWTVQGHDLVITIAGLRRGRASRPGLEVCWRGQHFQGSPMSLRTGRDWIHEFKGETVRAFGSAGKKDGQLNHPRGICVGNGEIFVSDFGNNRVEVFDLEGRFVRKFGAASGAAALSGPHGLFVDGGEVFICDFENNRVCVFSVAGEFVREWGSYGFGDGQFNKTYAVSVFRDEVFVVDYTGRVSVFDRQGTFRRKWTHQLVGGNRKGIAVLDNRAYVSDFGNGRVVVFTLEGECIRHWDCPGAAALWVDDECVWVVSFDVSSFLILFDGSGTEVKRVEIAPGGRRGEVNTPCGVCSTDDGVFITEFDGHRVVLFA